MGYPAHDLDFTQKPIRGYASRQLWVQHLHRDHGSRRIARLEYPGCSPTPYLALHRVPAFERLTDHRQQIAGHACSAAKHACE